MARLHLRRLPLNTTPQAVYEVAIPPEMERFPQLEEEVKFRTPVPEFSGNEYKRVIVATPDSRIWYAAKLRGVSILK